MNRNILLLLLLLLIPLQALTARTRLSPTADEGAKLASGFHFLTTGHLDLDREHPPFGKLLSGLPLLFMQSRLHNNFEGEWDVWFPHQLVRDRRDVDTVFLWAVVSNSLLAVLLAAVVFFWASQLLGGWAGWIALILIVFDPGILSMASLVNTDLPAAAFIVLTLYLAWRLVRRPHWLILVGAGLALGLALVSKFSALVLFPMLALILGAAWLMPWAAPRLGSRFHWPYPQRSALTWLAFFGSMTAIAGLIVCIFYGFQFQAGADLKIPLPALGYRRGVKLVIEHAQRGHPAFLAGEYSIHGWWYYFPLALLLKTPLPTLILAAAGSWLSLRSLRQRLPVFVFLVCPTLIYLAFSMSMSINIGYRHILPMLPLLFVLAGAIGAEKAGGLERPPRLQSSGSRWSIRTVSASLLCAWLIWETAWIWPDHLAYFNQAAGGPAGGHRWLLDSNLDWGQDLKKLKDYMEQRRLSSVKLSYFGVTSPSIYGIKYECLPTVSVQNFESCGPDGPISMEPGTYVISAMHLYGLLMPDRETFAAFRSMQPTDRIGYSLFVYELK